MMMRRRSSASWSSKNRSSSGGRYGLSSGFIRYVASSHKLNSRYEFNLLDMDATERNVVRGGVSYYRGVRMRQQRGPLSGCCPAWP